MARIDLKGLGKLPQHSPARSGLHRVGSRNSMMAQSYTNWPHCSAQGKGSSRSRLKNSGLMGPPALSAHRFGLGPRPLHSLAYSRSLREGHVDDLPTLADRIKVVAPPLRHTNTLVPVLAAVINSADCVAVTVGKTSLDSVGVP